MKNRTKLCKTLSKFLIILLIFLIGFFTLKYNEYKKYNKIYNTKIEQIISIVKEQYPDIDENEIMALLNSEKSTNVLEKYSIDLDKPIIKKNETIFKNYLILNIILIIILGFTYIIILFRYDNKKRKEINSITKYIEQINKKNYKLEIDDMSEDELSILKNEIYKTTIMLKEDSENSKKDKLELKKSLEDISHQLKTPLTSILIMLDSIIDNEDMDLNTRMEFIRDIKKEIGNINFLVGTILKLSKFDACTINLDRKDVKISNLINESISKILPICDLKNIKINTEIKEDFEIFCDLNWQVEAISNILKNSIEHSYEDSFINIKCKNNQIYSEIVIQDFGIGIDKKDIKHIFERFYKSKNSKGDSVGIGLSLSKKIIENDSGTIIVESNECTTFTIRYYHI